MFREDQQKYVIMISHVMPFPSAAGNEISIAKVLQFLKRNGFKTIFVLNQRHVDENALLELKKHVEEVYFPNIDSSKIDKKIVAPSIEYLSNKNQNKKDLCPPELVFLTSVLCKKYNPFAVIAQYIFTTPCLDVVPDNVLKIVDTHDMFSRRPTHEVIYCTPEEERDYLLKSGVIIAIQDEEAEMFRKLVPERRVITRGLDYDIPDAVDENDIVLGSVLLIGSDNDANVKGLAEFAAHTWPLVKKEVPNAQLRVIGKICNKFKTDDPSIKLLGFVESLDDEYTKAAVVVNTTTYGTGLKIKTVEALCHGKAFIGTANSVDGMPIAEQEAFISCSDWNSFAVSLAAVLNSDEKRKELQEHALIYCRKYYNKEIVWAPFLQELKQHLTTFKNSDFVEEGNPLTRDVEDDDKKNIYKVGLMSNEHEVNYGNEVVCFQISNYNLSFTKIFNSAFASPGRYIMEMFVRLFSAKKPNENLVVFNPFFTISGHIYERVKSEIDKLEDNSSIAIFTTQNEIPIAYYFPEKLPFYDARYLSFLSAMYAELDTEFLRNCFLIKSQCVYLKDVSLNKKKANNGFNYNYDFDRVYAWVTDSALKTLYKKYGRSLSNDDLGKLDDELIKALSFLKHSIPCDVLMPHHAGDALFLSLALKNSLSFIKKVVISSWYKDIIEDSSPDVETFAVNVTPCFRDNNNKPDEVMFWEVISKLKGPDLNESFHYYFRPSREYRISDFHLTDHFYFAVGASINSRNDLLSSRLEPENNLPVQNESSFKILIHLEGGWPLKTYPQNYFNELIKLFHNKGYQITVLSSKLEKSKLYDVVKYTNLSEYKNLLASYNLLIGMDSFPVHYGAHITGTPTICIFGNTKPVNSDARISKFYNYVFGELKCAGCFGFDRCPLNNKTTCNNFPKPEKIYETAVKMLDELYNVNKSAIEEKEKEAAILINEGKLNEAINCIESALDISPDLHDAHFLLGVLNDAVNNSDKTIFHYEKAASINPENIFYEKTLADYYNFKLNRTEQALEKYLGILRKQPSNTNVLILVGNILAINGNTLEASKYYSQALIYEPGNQMAIENLMSLSAVNTVN
jgi:tetratricopeptide (TPR) repeat protein